MRSDKTCIMGCPPGYPLHTFPGNPQSRAEWFRILKINPSRKWIFLCELHFENYYINGKRLSKFAKPKPWDGPVPSDDEIDYFKAATKSDTNIASCDRPTKSDQAGKNKVTTRSNPDPSVSVRSKPAPPVRVRAKPDPPACARPAQSKQTEKFIITLKPQPYKFKSFDISTLRKEKRKSKVNVRPKPAPQSAVRSEPIPYGAVVSNKKFCKKKIRGNNIIDIDHNYYCGRYRFELDNSNSNVRTKSVVPHNESETINKQTLKNDFDKCRMKEILNQIEIDDVTLDFPIFEQPDCLTNNDNFSNLVHLDDNLNVHSTQMDEITSSAVASITPETPIMQYLNENEKMMKSFQINGVTVTFPIIEQSEFLANNANLKSSGTLDMKNELDTQHIAERTEKREIESTAVATNTPKKLITQDLKKAKKNINSILNNDVNLEFPIIEQHATLANNAVFPKYSGAQSLQNELDVQGTQHTVESSHINEIRSSYVASSTLNNSITQGGSEFTLRKERNLYRKKYIEELKEKNKVKIENFRLAKELQRYKDNSKTLTSEMQKTSQISPSIAVGLSNHLKKHEQNPQSKRYDYATKLISLAIRHLNPLEIPSQQSLQRFLKEYPDFRHNEDKFDIEFFDSFPDFLL